MKVNDHRRCVSFLGEIIQHLKGDYAVAASAYAPGVWLSKERGDRMHNRGRRCGVVLPEIPEGS